MSKLAQLHVDIDVRVHTILQDRADWLCAKGCDKCCRQLAEVPQLTLAEWDLLQAGLQDLTQYCSVSYFYDTLRLSSIWSKPWHEPKRYWELAHV